MGKPALCIRRADVVIDFNNMGVQQAPTNLFDLETQLVDRDLCESDTSLLQLLPYIVVRNDGGKIFLYERDVKGGEPGLHGKLSIGLGGHVDSAPPAPGADALVGLLLAEAERELLEEAGVKAELSTLAAAVVYTGAASKVDAVHLGIILEHTVPPGTTIVPEPGHIKDGRFVTLAELTTPETFDRLEPWSQAIVREYNAALSCQLGEVIEHFCGLMYGVQLESMTGITATSMQEVSAVLSSISMNLKLRHAVAKVFDADQMRMDVAAVNGSLDHASMLAGVA
jgi:predicted NUDIX family phosphoesterase